MSNLCEHQS